MKKFVLIVALFLHAFNSQAQDKIFKLNEVDSYPILKDFRMNLDSLENKKEVFFKELRFNLISKIDQEILVKLIKKGRFFLQLKITKTSHATFSNSNLDDKKINAELRKVVSKLVFSSVAVKNGKFVDVEFVLLVQFKKDEKYKQIEELDQRSRNKFRGF